MKAVQRQRVPGPEGPVCGRPYTSSWAAGFVPPLIWMRIIMLLCLICGLSMLA